MTTPCEQCGGACCKVLKIDLSTTDADHRRLVSMRGIAVGDVVYLPAPCSCLKDGRCTIYHDTVMRPDICRLYAVGGPECVGVLEAMGII